MELVGKLDEWAGSGHGPDDLHGFHAHGANAGEEGDDGFLVVGETVGVELLGHGGVADLVFLPLVEHPFQTAAVAEFVIPSLGGDAAEGGDGVNLDGTGFLARAILTVVAPLPKFQGTLQVLRGIRIFPLLP